MVSGQRYRLHLRAASPVLLGGVGDREPGVHAATALLPAPAGDGAGGGGPTARTALLLGSSLKGVLRHDARRLAAARGSDCAWEAAGADGGATCACLTCTVFGAGGRPGKVAVRSGTAEAADLVAVSGVGIDRRTRTADRAGRRLWSELRALASFTADLVLVEPLAPEEAEFLELLLDWEQATGLRLGRRKSAGLGSFELAWEGPLEEAAPTARPAPAPAAASERRRYLLHVEALEPLRLAGPPQRLFYRDALTHIPASTLRGALGWALARRGDGDLARELFESPRPVRLTDGAYQPRGEPPPRPWLGMRECRGPERHATDPALAWVAAALGAGAPAEEEVFTCARCGQPLKPASLPDPPVLVIGQTEIAWQEGRARDGTLRYQVAVQPGACFQAELDAFPEQAEVLRSLGEVLVGGHRSRGLGSARVAVEDAGVLPAVAERVARTTALLERRGARLGGDQVAVLGLLADGWPGEGRSLEELLRAHGLEVVTAQARAVARGGYDERGRATRPLRQVLARGSWVAVRGRDLTGPLEELERGAGLGDPLDPNPLWLRVRDDWEDGS